MQPKWLLWLVLILGAVALVALPPNRAFAKQDFDKVTVSGPGLAGEVEITRQEVEDLGLTDGMIDEFSQDAVPAPQVSKGYTITRYFKQEDGTFFVWDQIGYYLDKQGNRGYVLFVYVRGGSPTEVYAGKWFDATPQRNVSMQHVLARLGVQIGTPSTLPATGGRIQSFGWLVVLGGAMFLIGCSLLKFTYDHRV